MKNFFIKFWNGGYSLAFSYWIVGSLVASLFYVSVALIANNTEDLSSSLTSSSWLLAISVSALWVFQIWAYVGIWRSATNYGLTKRHSYWGQIAKFFIVIGLLNFVNTSATQYFPLIRVMSSFMFGGDPVGKVSLEVIDENKTLKISGVFGNGSFNEIKSELKNYPTIKRLYLSSNGGRFKEVSQIAKLIQERHLETYVEDKCLSFCTIVFLSGNPRYATPTARIGFHAPTIKGAEALTNDLGLVAGSIDLYKSFNLPKEFVDKIFATPNSEMWYPSYQELLSLGIVSNMSLGGESSYTSTKLGNSKEEVIKTLESYELFRKYEKKFPGFISMAADTAIPLIKQGRPDSEVFSAVRGITIPLQGKAIANSNQAIRLKFAELGRDEAIEVSKYGASACAAFLDGKLDITKVLPKEMVARELKLSEEALDLPTVKPDFNKISYEKALQLAASSLTPEEINAVSNPTSQSGDIVCTGMVKFYKGIDELPTPQKDLLIYGMYK